MKFHFLFLFLLFFTKQSNAQSFIKSFQDAYISDILDVEILENGEIITAGYSREEENFGRDTPVIKRFEPDGTLNWSGELPNLVMGSYLVTEMKATPDGGWAICGKRGDCDALYGGFFYKFNDQSELQWSLNEPFSNQNDHYPFFDKIGFLPGNKIYLTVKNRVMIYNEEGTLLDDLEIPDMNALAFKDENTLIGSTQGGEIYVFSYPEIENYYSFYDFNIPALSSFHDLSLENVNYSEGHFVVQREKNSHLHYFDVDCCPVLAFALEDNQKALYSSNLNGLLVIGEIDDENNGEFFVIDTTGYNYAAVFQSEYPNDFSLNAIKYQDSILYVGGHERVLATTYDQKKVISLLHKQDISEPTLQPSLDLEITSIMISSPVQTSLVEYYDDLFGHVYGFENIEIEVTNNSSATVNSLTINTLHERFNPYYCYTYQDDYYMSEELNLQPGQTKSVIIDELNVFEYDTSNYKLCFWVTSPNNEPDLVHENDSLCTSFDKDYISSILDFSLKTPTFSVAPNPAQNTITITSPFTLSTIKEYGIYNANSQEIKKGTFVEDQAIDIRSFSKGVYFLKISTNLGIETLKFIKI